jgi:hypothetical protein
MNIPIEKFQVTLEKLMRDNNFKNQIIRKQNQFVENYLANHGSSSKKLIEYIKTM